MGLRIWKARHTLSMCRILFLSLIRPVPEIFLKKTTHLTFRCRERDSPGVRRRGGSRPMRDAGSSRSARTGTADQPLRGSAAAAPDPAHRDWLRRLSCRPGLPSWARRWRRAAAAGAPLRPLAGASPPPPCVKERAGGVRRGQPRSPPALAEKGGWIRLLSAGRTRGGGGARGQRP